MAKLRPIYDAEDMLRYGLYLIYKNEEGPAKLADFKKAIAKNENKGKIISIKKDYYGMYIGHLKNVIIPKIAFPLGYGIDLGPFILAMYNVADIPNIVSIFAWGSRVEDRKKANVSGIFRPLLMLVRQYYYSWPFSESNEKYNEMVIYVDGKAEKNEVITQEYDKDSINAKIDVDYTPQQMTMISYISKSGLGIVYVAFSLDWYEQYLTTHVFQLEKEKLTLASLAQILGIDGKKKDKDKEKEK